MSIVATVRLDDFFAEIVEDSMKSREVQASEAAKTYVVSLLSDLAKPGSAVERTMEHSLTLLLDEALHTEARGDRFERLRALGDGVLYASGFFSDHFEARGVDANYVMGIGKTAYESAGSLLYPATTRGSTDDIFHELATGFASFVAVIADVANTTLSKGVSTSRGLLHLYERWLKTRSGRLAETLSTHGFVAPRGDRKVYS